MDSLTKENFWNDLHTIYPAAVDDFCKWIDDYKKKVGWNEVFNSNSEYQNSEGKNALAPKFHDLPFDMQAGILIRYIEETEGEYTGIHYVTKLKESFVEFFKERHEQISN